MDRFKGVGSFKDDLYTGMSKDSSKFFTEARNIGNRDEDIFLDLKTSIWIYDRSFWFLFRAFIHPMQILFQ